MLGAKQREIEQRKKICNLCLMILSTFLFFFFRMQVAAFCSSPNNTRAHHAQIKQWRNTSACDKMIFDCVASFVDRRESTFCLTLTMYCKFEAMYYVNIWHAYSLEPRLLISNVLWRCPKSVAGSSMWYALLHPNKARQCFNSKWDVCACRTAICTET